MRRSIAGLILPAILCLFQNTSVLAHHYFANFSEEQIVLRGTVVDVFIENPHGILTIRVDNEEWDAFLGSVRNSEDAGLDEKTFRIGEPVVIYGHPSVDPDKHEVMTLQILYRGNRYRIFHEIEDR